MLARLWWKEWRTLWPAALVVGLAAAGLQWLLISVDGEANRLGFLTSAALGWAMLYAFAAGSAAFAGEREARTLGFLDALPVARGTLWAGKSSFALASTLALALLLAALASTAIRPADLEGPSVYGPIARGFGVLLFEAVAYGLLWSSVARNALLAGAMAVVSVAAVAIGSERWLQSTQFLASPELVAGRLLPARLILAGAALGASALAMTLRPRSWGAWLPSDRPEPNGAIQPRRASVVRSLVWQAAREGRGTRALVAVLGAIIPLSALFGNDPGLGVFSATLASLLAGVAVFGAEGGPGSRRILAHHGVAPGVAWAGKLLAWVPGMGLGLAVFLMLYGRGPGGQAVLIAAALLDLFAIGLVCGMAMPRRITAALVAVIAAVAVAPIQIAAASMEMVPAWSLLLTPAALIVASRGWAGDWLGEREGARPWARLGLLLAVPMGLIGSGYVGYRAWGVPDVGPQFDPAAARGPAIPPGRDAAEGYREALALVHSDGDPAPIDEIIARGWDPSREDVVAWWRANLPAIAIAREASALPSGRFEDPGRLTIETPLAPVVQGARTLSLLLALDARERLTRGDLAGAWADILAQFRMAGQLAGDSPTIIQALVAAQVHHRAVGLAFDWAGDPRQTPGSIRSARDDLGGLAPVRSAAACLRVESGIVDRSLELPAETIGGFFISGPRGGASALGNLANRYLFTPWWERSRARRLGRRTVAESIPVVEREPWERGASAARLDHPPVGSPLLKMIEPAIGPVVWNLDREVAGRRALEQVLAIRSYQLGHGGEAPGRLDDLVPGELARLPVDPYSGRPFGYLRSSGQFYRAPIEPDRQAGGKLLPTRPGQPILYSVGPDGVDNQGSRPFVRGGQGDGDLLFPIP